MQKDDGWARYLRDLSKLAAEAVKSKDRKLSPEDERAIHAARHYLKLALKNDAYWKEGNVA